MGRDNDTVTVSRGTRSVEARGGVRQRATGAGRPSSYSDDYPEIVRRACARYPLTDAELAKYLGVSHDTIRIWCAEYPEFRDAVNGAEELCTDRVERALYQRAIGYSVVEMRGDVRIKRHVPADTTAALAWLERRRPERWRRPSTDVVVTAVNQVPAELTAADLAYLATVVTVADVPRSLAAP